ncbi:MAG: hypothetical protein EHM12_02485 [Dehalococcoidia bacterium]|nr:MAG: hypothetical protein EHM12_02485 [Dehalococcoidia bacterium]
MPKFVANKVIFLLPALLAAQLLTGCAPAISQEQFDSVQAELKATKEQLASAKAELAGLKSQPVTVQQDQLGAPAKTLAALKPYLDLDLLILDEEMVLSQQSSKEITVSYANMQYAEQRSRLSDLLTKFDDREFARAVELAWSDSKDAKARWIAWSTVYSTVRNKMKDGFDTLSKQLAP